MNMLNTLLLLFLLSCFCSFFVLAQPNSAAADFIRAECRATRYPALCVRSLSNYVATIQLSDRQLAKAALSVSLSRAKSTASFVSKLHKTGGLTPKESGAVADCVENMVDAVDLLIRSIKELGTMAAPVQDFAWHVSNVQTWVSAALTDETTCLDGLGRAAAVDGEVKVAIRKRVSGCARVTSNALAFVNRLAGSRNSEITQMLP